MKIPVKELKPGMYLAEDLFDRTQNIPLFSNGIQLNDKNIQQIQKHFDEDYSVSVIVMEESIAFVKDKHSTSAINMPLPQKKEQKKEEATVKTPHKEPPPEKAPSEKKEEKTINAQDVAKGDFQREDALDLFKDNLLKTPEYQNSKSFVNTYFHNVGSILTTFSKTGDINEGEVLDLAHNAVNEIQSETGYFDPSLLYLVQIEQWDPTTYQHSFDVATFTLVVATKIGSQFEELTSLFIAGLLHDIGKFIYSKMKLNDMEYIIKKPGRLTDEEYAQIKRHVDVYRFIKGWFPNLSPRHRENILYGIMDHHERLNGSGYLHGKKGVSIAFSARLIAICDVYDALIRRRSYKTMINPSRAMFMLVEMQKNGLFDRKIFNKFYSDLGRFPTGGVVMTNKGIATVVRQNSKDPTRPVIVFPDSNEEVNTLVQSDLEVKDV